MQNSRLICDTKVPGRYRSIWTGTLVGVASGVGRTEAGADGSGVGTRVGVGSTGAVIRGVAVTAVAGGRPAWATGATAITTVQPAATMTTHSTR